jgi:hypothetical protein
MSCTLVILAAGLGSRYGGLKQIDPVGPGGETVLDYAVFDALRAGFSRIVFVIRRDIEAVFRENVGAKYAGRAEVEYVFQSPDELPAGFRPGAGRSKPLGTGHAVWCARNCVREPFAVINADDFYGAESFRQLGAFLTKAGRSDEFAMVGFRLAGTLSEHGGVARGICSVAGGRLGSIDERTAITPADIGPGRVYSGEETVSMNCWGFTTALFPALESELSAFLKAKGADPAAEFYLPAAISGLIAKKEAQVWVLPTGSPWFGVTYRDDKPKVASAIADLVRRGVYPPRLFS